MRGGAGAARVSRAPPGPPPFEMFSRAAGRRAEECATAEAERAPGPAGCEGREWSRRRADARRRAWMRLRARRGRAGPRGAHDRPDAPRRRRTEFPSEQFRTLPRGGGRSASPPERYVARCGPQQRPRARTHEAPRRRRRPASHDPFARNTSRREAPAGAAARRGAPALMRACLSTDRADAAPPYGAARAAHHTQETVSHRCRKR